MFILLSLSSHAFKTLSTKTKQMAYIFDNSIFETFLREGLSKKSSQHSCKTDNKAAWTTDKLEDWGVKIEFIFYDGDYICYRM